MGPGSSLASDVSLNSVLSEAEHRRFQDPAKIVQILRATRTIAIVGLSPRSERPSYFVGSYLQSEGYRIIPVNPRAEEILGERSYPDLLSIPDKVDMVDVFRQPHDCIEIARQAVAIGAKTLWLQLRIVSLEAAQIAEAGGLNVVMDRCAKVEHGRYSGTLHWVGMNTEIISARRGRSYVE